MISDIFKKEQAWQLIQGKKIWFFGSSNMRAIYKDLLWLVTYGSIASESSFKVKNEPSFLNDVRLSNSELHNGCDYKEIREFKYRGTNLLFYFLTRVYLDDFVDFIKKITHETAPDIIFINSCLWDLTRWGPTGPHDFKINLLKTLKLFKSCLPSKTVVMWKTSLPISTTANGAIFVDEIKYIVPLLPWHLIEANNYASTCLNFFNYDTLDFHHYMRFQGHLRVKDGIHWAPVAMRYLTNSFLTHLCLIWNRSLPNNRVLTPSYLESCKVREPEEKIQEKIQKKDNFFTRWFSNLKKKHGVSKNKGSGIKNKFKRTLQPFIKRNKYKNNYHNNINFYMNNYSNYKKDRNYYYQYNFN